MSLPQGVSDAWRGLLIAARFLTRAPLPDPGWPPPEQVGRAALFYPLIGLLIGGFLLVLALVLVPLAGAAPAPAAALVLIAWVWSTGALHLDGLADCADAWVGGLGDRERTLAILSDPATGAMGVVTLVLVLLAKWTGLEVLLAALADCERDASAVLALLLWLPAVGRGQLLLLALTTHAARAGGMGAAMQRHLPRAAAWGVLAAVWLGAGAHLGVAAIAVLCAAALTILPWRRAMLHRLGGFTGDTAGALVEMTETAALLLAATLLSGGTGPAA